MRFILLVVPLLAGFAEAEFLVINIPPIGESIHWRTSSGASFVPTDQTMLDTPTPQTCAFVVSER